jgi:hypothetical protein
MSQDDAEQDDMEMRCFALLALLFWDIKSGFTCSFTRFELGTWSDAKGDRHSNNRLTMTNQNHSSVWKFIGIMGGLSTSHLAGARFHHHKVKEN